MKCTVCYEIWSPEAIEAGDTDDRGIEGVIEFEDFIELARFVEDLHGCSPSCSQFYPGVWYTSEPDRDWYTGDGIILSYHFSGIPEELERLIYAYLTE